MVFCNKGAPKVLTKNVNVTILILIDGFLQYLKGISKMMIDDVTILILIDGFLQ